MSAPEQQNDEGWTKNGQKQEPEPSRDATGGEPWYRAIHEPRCEFRLYGAPYTCTCSTSEGAK